jgi:hypothetical protein
MQARGQVRGAGVLTPDEAMPGAAYIKELAERGVELSAV